MPAWPELRDQKWLDRFLGNEQAATFWSAIFQYVYDGFNTWDYIWLFTLWCHDGLTILPNVNLVSNIGFGSGTHTTMKDSPLANMKTTAIVFPLSHPTVLERNIEADRFTESTQFSKVDLSSSEKAQNKCKICGSHSYHFANADILQKYDVTYFQCSNCKFIQTEEPYWLEEAYSKVIASSDVGLVYRNIAMAEITSKLLFNFFDHNASFLDYGGGYGLFVRLMRDKGFNFYWEDKYCQNLFAQEFEFNSAKHNKILLTTAFELFEHFVNPVQEIEKILKISPNVLFSTQLLPENNPKPSEWWYYTPHEGQHISIFTKQSLTVIAQKYNLNFYTDGSSLHLLTDQIFPEDIFQKLLSRDIGIPNKSSLLSFDYQRIVGSILGHPQPQSEVLNPDSSPRIEGTFLEQNQSQLEVLHHPPVIVIDGVFFQMYSTGIARVWRSLLKEWSKTDFAKHILVLDRGGNSAPKIEGIRYRAIPLYDYGNTEADKQMLQEVCNQENADLFISTYYTTPLETPSIFMAYDMIPEVIGVSLDTPMWREKHHAIRHACGYISISGNTADDLSRLFTGIDRESITVAHCGVASFFSPASQTEKDNFKFKYGIHKPYFLLGNLLGPKNGILFFKACQELANRHNFDIVCTGLGIQLPGEWRQYTSGCVVHNLYLTDDELRIAYSAAIALIYPSKYEGFGMPIVEAMACGCPVITTRNGSIPEVAGEAALYVGDDDIEGMADALYEVQKPRVRRSLIQKGLVQAQKFSWNKMANIVREKLLNHLSNVPISVIEKLNSLSSEEPTLNYYAQYVQKLCPQVNPQIVKELLSFAYSCNWDQPYSLEDYNNIAVICLIEAEETQDLSFRKQLLTNAVTVLEKAKDYPLCATHLALIYSLMGECQQGYNLANAVLTELKKSPIKDSFGKGLIYLPPISRSLFRQRGNLERLLATENADEQVFQLCIEALYQSSLIFYNDKGQNALTLASEKLINFPILDWLKGIVKIHCQQPDGILFLEQAQKLMPNYAPLIHALYLAYRSLPDAETTEYWRQEGLTYFNPNSPDVGQWIWTQVKPETPFTYLLYDNLILTVEANLKSITTAVLLAQGDWFEAEMELWRTQIRLGMTVIDVGANVGVYTFSAAQRVGETGKVISIGPFKNCVSCLQETSRINKLPWVKIYEAAASDYCGSAKLSLHNASELNEVISDNSPSSDSAQTVTIECLTLDSLMETENLTRVDWLKIDAEGHEIKVLQGAETLLTQFKPNIIYENIGGVHRSNGDVTEYLKSKGYQIYSYRPYVQELVPMTNLNQVSSQLNLIAVYNPNN
ncbi:FkbM family methyltransferase [Geminocystis sp. CENA526]|uniref:FkbM family methyltransferase n=1 Tax=Geminocystis sp. CENA526 TaxID=1355871 RepID=UPI003D6FB605